MYLSVTKRACILKGKINIAVMWGIKQVYTVALAALVANTTAAEWGTDYEAALAASRAQGKPVLVDFTGSDWCYYCMQLRRNVLDHPGFAAWSAEHFVLLEVDVPENPDFDPELLAQNRKLCSKYEIDSYPTLLVLDGKGRPLGGLYGYVGDPAAVQKLLTNGLRAHELLEQAAGLQGEQQLLAMIAAWRLLPEEVRELNTDLQQQIAVADTQDLSGLRAAAAAEQHLQQTIAAEKAAPTDAAALALIENALAQSVPANRRQLLELKYRLLVITAETPADVQAAEDAACDMIDADLRLSPGVKESRKRQMRGVFANPQTTLNRARMIRRKRPRR